jgi:hypothetical protein
MRQSIRFGSPSRKRGGTHRADVEREKQVHAKEKGARVTGAWKRFVSAAINANYAWTRRRLKKNNPAIPESISSQVPGSGVDMAVPDVRKVKAPVESFLM